VLLIAAFALILFLPGKKSPVVLHHSGSGKLAYSLPHRLGPTHHTVKSATQRVILTVEPTHPGTKFAPGSVGLSVEANQLATQDLSANHKSLVALMRRLGPGVLRIGGGSLDYSWWTSDDEQPPVWATSVVTSSDLINLHSLLVAADWRVILGVDLGHFDPARAANEARVAERILGSSLLGFEIGNEPNGYVGRSEKLRASSYSADNYLGEIDAYSAAMRTAAPWIRLYGPDLSSPAWLPTIVSDKTLPFDAITEHYYPTFYSVPKGVCEGTPIPPAMDLLSPEVREQENSVLQTLVRAGQIAHREVRISETNTTASCDVNGGPATSPVFASALWSLDWVLRAASAGVAGLNFHGNFGLCGPYTFSPVCEPDNAAAARGQVIARPEYYGLLAARELEGGRFIPVDINGQSTSREITAYATIHSPSVITLAIDNFAMEGSTDFLLRVPGYNKATSKSLVGPSISATSGVTFGHTSINAAGVLRATGTRVRNVDGTLRLKVEPASAMVITLYR
jgi:hypothetical protein